MIVNLRFLFQEPSLRELCKKPYMGHPNGCPNYGKRKTCPPKAKLFFDVFDSDLYIIYTKFDLKTHVKKMKKKHPKWTKRQLYCCLYWQGTARKNLKKEIEIFKKDFPNHIVTTCPEAMGLNITEIMHDNADIDLEWPPENITYQVAIAGLPKQN